MAGIDFTPDIRSVYFSSLSSHQGYEQIYTQGVNYLKLLPSLDIKHNKKANSKIKLAIKVLEDGIQKEQNTEEQYLKNLINSLSSIKDKETQQALAKKISNIFSTKPIDYFAFIELLNTILMGSENYKKILELEQKRTEELTNSLNKLEENILKQEQEKQGENYNEKESKEQLQESLRNTYLERHSFSNSNYSHYFSEITPTIDYLLSQYIVNITDKILKSADLKSKILAQIESKKGTNQEIGTYILNNIIDQTQKQVPKIVDATLRKTAVRIDDLIKEIDTSAFKEITINGESNDFGLKNKISKNIAVNKKTQEIQTKGNNLADTLLELLPTLNKFDTENELVNILNKKSTSRTGTAPESLSIFDLLRKLQEKIDDLNNNIIKLTELEGNGPKKRNNKQTRETAKKITDEKKAIETLKRRISRFVHKELRKKIYQDTEKETQILAAKKIKEMLTPSIVAMSGPQFSEIIDNFLQQASNGATFFSGPYNTKADTVTIQITPQENTLNFPSSKITSIINTALSDNVNNFYTTFQENLPGPGEATSFKQGKQAWHTAVKQTRKKILSELKKNEKENIKTPETLKLVAERMRSTIVVTETVKTFNQYYNEIGFLSGSIGPNIQQQINNFAELFSEAGVPMSSSEQDWLITALVNCSSNTLGEKNRDPIEKYLSVMAGFAVFDEGSAEIELIAGRTVNEYTKNSPQIMHLYKLNGLYFPGSFILQRIHENLDKYLTEAEDEILNNDGAVIRATASEKLIGNHNQDSGQERWSRVYNAAQDNSITSISVAFLSGLFNIVEQLYTNIFNV